MPSLSTKMHFLKHTEIYGSSAMIAHAPQDILWPIAVAVRYGVGKRKGDNSEDAYLAISILHKNTRKH